MILYHFPLCPFSRKVRAVQTEEARPTKTRQPKKSQGYLDLMSSRGTPKLSLGQTQNGGFNNAGNDTINFDDLPI